MKSTILAVWITIALWTLVASGQEQLGVIETSPLLPASTDGDEIVRYPVANRGDVLLIPVSVRGIEYKFLLDTGAMTNVLDKSLADELGPLSRSRQSYPKGFPATYVLPEFKLSSTDIQIHGDAIIVDLAELRRMSGYNIKGILGINFLRKFVIELDFDSGSVAFFERAPGRATKPIPMRRDQFNRPVVLISIAPDLQIPFLIDTGMASPGIGEVTSSTFEELRKSERLQMLATKARTLTVDGVVTNPKAQLDVFKFGEYEHRNLQLNRGTLNALGLQYLSRYKITLDLMSDQAWFEPGKTFSRPPVFDASGMIISTQGEWIVVDRVHPDGPAFAAGIQPDDVLTHLNGCEVSNHSLFTIRQILCEQNCNVKMTIQRSGVSRDYDFLLSNWQNAVLDDSK